MDKTINKINEACIAAERIVNMIESAGFDMTDPSTIVGGQWNDYPDNMSYAHGASRVVVWDDNYCDFVVKLPLGEFAEKYCQHEVEVYEAAVKAGYSDYFGWCMCYAEPYEEDGVYHPGIYVMEFLDGSEDEVSDSAWQYGYNTFCKANGLDASDWDNMDRYNSSDRDDYNELMDLFTSGWSTSEAYDFGSFLYNNNVNDIHTGNVLWRGNKLVICDYAGWGW